MIVVMIDAHSGGATTVKDTAMYGKGHGYDYIFLNVPHTQDEYAAEAVAACWLSDTFGENPYSQRCPFCCGQNFSIFTFETLEQALQTFSFGKPFGELVRSGRVMPVYARKLAYYSLPYTQVRCQEMAVDAEDAADEMRRQYPD